VALRGAPPVALSVGRLEVLAGFHMRPPQFAVDIVFEQLFAVQPVFHVLATGHDPRLVPLTERMRDIPEAASYRPAADLTGANTA